MAEVWVQVCDRDRPVDVGRRRVKIGVVEVLEELFEVASGSTFSSPFWFLAFFLSFPGLFRLVPRTSKSATIPSFGTGWHRPKSCLVSIFDLMIALVRVS